MCIPLLLFALLAIGPATGDVILSFNGAKGLLSAPLPVEYASFNIDSASLYHLFDFKDVRLRNLVKQITPPGAWMRIGGTSSGGIVFTGVNGRRNECPAVNGHNGCINAEYWDEIADFVNYTGVRLLFDFSGNWFNAAGDWDPTLNVISQLAYTQAKGYGKNWAWQMGNENMLGHTQEQWGQYFLALKKVMSQFPNIGQTLNGASSSAHDVFLRVVKDVLNIYSYHRYGPDVEPFDMQAIKKEDPCSDIRRMVDSIAPGVLVALEESACHPLGGHDGTCNRFVDGFYWIHVLTSAAERGCHILHRQDFVGYSFVGSVSHYTLAGPPGWVNGKLNGQLDPHPDWYTMVLFKQLVGLMPLGNVSLSGDAGEIADIDPHVWCGSKDGTVVFVYSNGHGSDVHLTSVSGINLNLTRTEYILTAPNNNMTADEIWLNGKQMTVGNDATLPEYPIPGSVSTTVPLVLPKFSYGFVVFNAIVPGCA